MHEGLYRKRQPLHRSDHYVLRTAIAVADAQPVVLKEPIDFAEDPLAVARLRNEFELGSQLAHTNIVRYIDFHWTATSAVLVRELFGTTSLRDCIAATGLDLELSLSIAVQMAEALAEVHRCNIIHRLVKPSNIFLDLAARRAKLGDFARSTAAHDASSNIADVMDSLPYLSPEQTGRTSQALDYRTDFYSFGITLYEMLTGRVPFHGADTMEMVHGHLARQPLPPDLVRPDLPAAVSHIVLKLLAKNPHERYRSAHALGADLAHCLRQLKHTGHIAPFSLGRGDLVATLQLSVRLYGRDLEKATLLSALQRVAARGTEFVLVTGPSGVGKTLLVNELTRSVLERHGTIISGKFDQHASGIPYVAIARALQSLVHQIRTAPDPLLRTWEHELSAALGANAGAVIEVVPELGDLIAAPPMPDSMSLDERRYRFQAGFLSLLRVAARQDRPLVLFLDDLQWADSGSLDLLDSLASAADISHLLILLACRDSGLQRAIRLMRKVEENSSPELHVQRLALQPLAQDSIAQLLADTFGARLDNIDAFGDLLMQKTAGNPFFVKQFLATLLESDSFAFDSTTMQWSWKCAEIASHDATENVAELMSRRLRLLPHAMQRTLQHAAVIGYEFDAHTLSTVSDRPIEEIHRTLELAGAAGLVVSVSPPPYGRSHEPSPPSGNAHFRFSHDRIFHGAYALMEDARRKEAHAATGRMLLEQCSSTEPSESVFHVVRHWNDCRDLLSSDEQRQLIELNFLAAMKATSAAAYESALQHGARAMELLPTNCWDDLHQLTFRIYSSMAELEYINGNHSASERIVRAGLSQNVSDIERAELCGLQVLLSTMSANYEDALDAGMRALELLGVALPAKGDRAALRSMMQTIEEKTSAEGPRSLVDHHDMADPTVLLAVKVMANMLPLTFLSDPALYEVVATMSVALSVDHGNAPESSVCYSGYGILLAQLGKFREAYEFGELALAVSETSNNGSQKCKAYEVLVAHLNHWVHPIGRFQHLSDEAYKTARESGEIQFAGYTMKYSAAAFLFMGKELRSLQEKVDEFASYCTESNNQVAVDVLRSYRLFLVHLTGPSLHATGTDSGDTNDGDHLQRCEENASTMAICVYRTLQCQLAFLLGNHQQAVEHAQAAAELLDSLPGSITQAHLAFYEALSLLSVLSDTPEGSRGAYRERLNGDLAKIRTWARTCPPNFYDMLCLLEAELARLDGRDVDALGLYCLAAEKAREQGFVHNAAIADELCARFWEQRGKSDLADIHLRKAHEGYTRWGAAPKVAELETRYPNLSSVSKARVDVAAGVLDSGTIIKASQAISSELDLDVLLRRIISIMVENTGAQFGAIVIDRNGRMVVAAAVEFGASEATHPEPTAPEGADRVSMGVLHYVRRTREPMTLSDARVDERFLGDPYIQKRQPRSVLCAPIMQQSRFLGAIYLENNLAAGVFNEERLQLVGVLSKQVAISIENATFFAEREAQTRELAREVAERRVAEEALQKSQELLCESEAVGHVGGWALDTCTMELTWTPETYRIHEVDSGFVPTLDNAIAFYTEATRPTIRHAVDRAIQYGEEFNVDGEIMTAKGHRRAVHAIGRVSRDAKRVYGFFQDITERVETQKLILRHQKLESIGVLAGGIAHDFNNLLGGIYGLVSLASESLKDGRGGDALAMLGTALKSFDRARALTTQLLTFAKGGSPVRETVDLRPMLEDTVSFTLSGTRVSVQWRIDEALWRCRADVHQLGHAVQNIVLNARQAMPDGGVLAIEATNHFANDLRVPKAVGKVCSVRLSFRDHGCGIEHEKLPYVFDPFFTTRAGGTGLGLATSHSIVTKHGGMITIDSQVNNGTVVDLYLPADVSSGVSAVPEETVETDATPMKVLVMDDEPIIRDTAERMLRRNGCDVIAVASGDEVLTALSRHQRSGARISVAILDLTVLGGKGGLEIAADCRSQDDSVALVASSGYSEHPVMQEPAAFGFDATLPKPYRLQDVASLLASVRQKSTLDESRDPDIGG